MILSFLPLVSIYFLPIWHHAFLFTSYYHLSQDYLSTWTGIQHESGAVRGCWAREGSLDGMGYRHCAGCAGGILCY